MSVFAFGPFDEHVLAFANGVPDAVVKELGITFAELPRDADLINPVAIDSVDELGHLDLQGSHNVGGDRSHKPTVSKGDAPDKGLPSGQPSTADLQGSEAVDNGAETATISDERAWQLARLIIDFYKEWKGL